MLPGRYSWNKTALEKARDERRTQTNPWATALRGCLSAVPTAVLVIGCVTTLYTYDGAKSEGQVGAGRTGHLAHAMAQASCAPGQMCLIMMQLAQMPEVCSPAARAGPLHHMRRTSILNRRPGLCLA